MWGVALGWLRFCRRGWGRTETDAHQKTDARVSVVLSRMVEEIFREGCLRSMSEQEGKGKGKSNPAACIYN